MVRSVLEYCCILWSPEKINLIEKLESIQRLLTSRIHECSNMNYWDRLSFLNLMSLQRRREKFMIIHMWKIYNGVVPNTFGFQFQESNRRGMIVKLSVFKHNCKKKHYSMKESSFFIKGPRLWNVVPSNIRNISNIDQFKRKLKEEFLSKLKDEPPIPGYIRANNNSIYDWT